MSEQARLSPVCISLLLGCWTAASAADLPLVDPTRPYDQPMATDPVSGQPGERALPLPVLQAVFVQGQIRSALVDGQRVSVGSQIGPYRVVAIQGRQVVVEHKEQQSVLKTGFIQVKRPASEDAK